LPRLHSGYEGEGAEVAAFDMEIKVADRGVHGSLRAAAPAPVADGKILRQRARQIQDEALEPAVYGAEQPLYMAQTSDISAHVLLVFFAKL
jgi:hypothetical protein